MREENIKVCYFCRNKNQEIDYKNVSLLKRYLNFSGRIHPRGRTGNCTKHQREIAKAIKKARQMALLDYIKA